MACAEGARLVQPKAIMGGLLRRLFGSLGIDGDGMEFEVEDVSPFILCDYVCVEGGTPIKPPFCAHPHAGTGVVSVHLEGTPMVAWDNQSGFEAEPLRAGGAYAICSGRGCVHDEGPMPLALEDSYSRADFGMPVDGAAQRFRFFQLWFDPGHIFAEAELPRASSCVVQPEAVPLLADGALKIRLLLGHYGEQTGIEMPVTVLHCAILPFLGSGRLHIPAGKQVFIFCMDRGVSVKLPRGAVSVAMDHELILAPEPEEYTVEVDVDLTGAEAAESPSDAKADQPAELLVGFGTPSGKKYYKLLGYGGALVASSEEKVRALMREYERDPRRFGADADSSTLPDTSKYGLQEGYKDPLDGRGECQRSDPAASAPEARWFEVELGPYQPKGKGKGK